MACHSRGLSLPSHSRLKPLLNKTQIQKCPGADDIDSTIPVEIRQGSECKHGRETLCKVLINGVVSILSRCGARMLHPLRHIDNVDQRRAKFLADGR